MLTPYDLASASPGSRVRAFLLVETLKEFRVKSVCDCGCGVSVFSNIAIEEGLSIIGFDLNRDLVSQAQAGNRFEGRFFVGNIEKMAFRDHSLEGIVAADVIEHLPNPKTVLREFARVLARGSMAVCSIPNHRFEHICNLFSLSQGDIGHHKTYSKQELEEILDGTDLKIIVHRHGCNIGFAMADALIAKLAILKYGREAIHHSEMALRTAKKGLLAWCYYIACKLSYPVLCILEYILPSFLKTENIIVFAPQVRFSEENDFIFSPMG